MTRRPLHLFLTALLTTAVPVGPVLASGGGGESKPATTKLRGGSEFVEIEPIALPVLRGGRVSKLVNFRITIELVPPKTTTYLAPMLPKLEDATITQLSALLSLSWPGEATLDYAVAKRRLLDRYTEITGKGVIVDVLIQSAFERPA